MYFWNTKALSDDIKNSKLTENDWKNYYLAGLIFLTLSIYIIALSPRENITSVLIEAILMIGIIIFGVNVTFNTHKASDNNVANYISKMTALSFPLSVKFFTLSMLIGFVMGIAEGAGLSLELEQSWFITVLSLSVEILLFWRLNTHLQSINT
ncbi:hypothetical protein EKO29_14665 [Colwellia sp. Arc7-635]|uniref:hypothetical protein n=1 Tax=Colwellia sp. Arc7-635 TaxID=2497879 RepID=UPI000F84F877|nr:hypothetical protein [Colwellia sp. Arc7-635]AZQ85114.1 hypothetical protein EKO29_14665 [Colwellia sp. Arc7-635]